MSSFLGIPLSEISLTTAGTFYTSWVHFLQCEHVGFQAECVNVSGVTATVSWELRSHDKASPVPFQVSGSTYTYAVAAATNTIGPGAGTGKLTFKSLATDTTGTEITVILSDTGTAGAEVATMTTDYRTVNSYGVIVDKRTITVTMDAGVSTAAQIKAALDGNAAIAAVLQTTATISGAMAAGVATLEGGGVFVDFTTSAPQMRAKVVVQTGAANAKLVPYFVGKS